jgi:hypothetical protein
MKALKVLIGAALAVAFAMAKPAVGQVDTAPQVKNPLILNVSGTVKYQNVEGFKQGSTATYSFNEKTVYLLVSNYVANAQFYSYTNIAGTNLPANGYIAFNPNRDVFYVTNKAGFYYPLNSFDANNQYFSWIELDSFVFYGEQGYLPYGVTVKGNQLFNSVAGYNINSQGNGPSTAISVAVLYIHDDPYNWDDADNPYVFWENYTPWGGYPLGDSDDEMGHNNSMIEMRGVLTASLHLKGASVNSEIDSEHLSLGGTGNFYEHDIYDLNGVLTSGHASLAP